MIGAQQQIRGVAGSPPPRRERGGPVPDSTQEEGITMLLVVGASGKLGGAITQRLLASGQAGRILTREQAAYQALLESGAQGIKGDLKERPSLDATCQCIDTGITTATAAQRSGADTLESGDLQR